MSVDTKELRERAMAWPSKAQGAFVITLTDEVDRLREGNQKQAAEAVAGIREMNRLRGEFQALANYCDPDAHDRLRLREETEWEPLLAAAKAEHSMHCREGHYTAKEAGNCPKLHGVVADECSVCKAIAVCEEKP